MKRFVPLFLAFLLFLTGCGAPAAPSGTDSEGTPDDSAPQELAPTSAPTHTPTPTAEPEPAISGEITGEAADNLSESQKALLLECIRRDYQALGSFSAPDISELYASGEAIDLQTRAREATAAVRSAALIDLSILSCRFTLECRRAEAAEDGSVFVMALEDSAVRFAATPDTDSETYDVYHFFVLTGSESGGWKIASHIPWESDFYAFMSGDNLATIRPEEGETSSPSDRHSSMLGDPALTLEERYEEQMALALENLADRQRQYAEYQNGAFAETLTPDNPYDRDAAVTYALQWVEERQEDWAVYDMYGGNCMNYVSQCLYAGGIPMDNRGASWYWYAGGDRTPSWSGVDSFRRYAAQNEGFGLVSETDADYYTGQPGDVLLMGTDDLRHAVIITGPVTDEAGRTLDYLVCSNTGNYRNYPASALFYTHQYLIRIGGWNA